MTTTRQIVTEFQKDNAAKQATSKRVQTAVVVVAAAVLAVLLAVDVVRTAPADTPVVQVSFDAPPPIDDKSMLAQPAERFERWAADESSRGTRPDGVH